VAFEERVAAAADARFEAIGLSVWEYDRPQADGYDDSRLRTVLDRRGMRVAELEVVLGFAATGPRWGTFNAGQLEDQAVEAFAALCDRAAADDLLVATPPRPDGGQGMSPQLGSSSEAWAVAAG